MAISYAMIIFSMFFLSLALSSTMASDDKSSTAPIPTGKDFEVVVEGLVYCQSCAQKGTWSLTDAKPIQSAKVSVICKSYTNQVKFYKVFETDANGYFYAQLQGYKKTNPLLDHPLQSCKVRLVSSPLKTCNLLSNINYGLYGAPLHFENKIVIKKDYKTVIYAAGPLAFRPNNCPPTLRE